MVQHVFNIFQSRHACGAQPIEIFQKCLCPSVGASADPQTPKVALSHLS